MRIAVFAFTLVSCLALAACGGDSGGGGSSGGAAGTYVIDGDAMMPEIEKMVAPAIEAAMKMMEMLPADQRAKKEAEMAESMKERKDKMLEEFTLEVVLGSDGSFTAIDDGKTKAKGTWAVDGSTLTFKTTEEDGKKKEETITGTYKDGTIRFRPEKGMPFDIVMKKK